MRKTSLLVLFIFTSLCVVPFSIVSADDEVVFYGWGGHAFAFTSLPDHPDLSIVVWDYKYSTFASFEELIIRQVDASGDPVPGMSVTITDNLDYYTIISGIGFAEKILVDDTAIQKRSSWGYAVFVLTAPVKTATFGTINPFIITFRSTPRSTIEQTDNIATPPGYTITNSFWLRDANAHVKSMQRPFRSWSTRQAGVGFATREITMIS